MIVFSVGPYFKTKVVDLSYIAGVLYLFQVGSMSECQSFSLG